MAFTNGQLAQQINNLVEYWAEFNVEYANWLGGSVGGGPNSDGRYELTDYLGNTRLVTAPAQLEDDISGLVGSADTSATAAAASAAAASTSASAADADRISAEAAQAAAESARDTATSQASASAGSAVTSTTQANLALTRANAAAASESAAATSETNAADSAAAAAASAAAAATFDPVLYAALADDETVTGAWTFPSLTVTGLLEVIRTSGNAGFELGNRTVSSTAFIDFHSSGNNNDYDVRFTAIGGTTVGTGGAAITAAYFDVNASLRTANLVARTTNGPLNIWGGVGGDGANIEMYGPSHGSQANNTFYDAAKHEFRTEASSKIASIESGLIDLTQATRIGATPTTQRTLSVTSGSIVSTTFEGTNATGHLVDLDVPAGRDYNGLRFLTAGGGTAFFGYDYGEGGLVAAGAQGAAPWVTFGSATMTLDVNLNTNANYIYTPSVTDVQSFPNVALGHVRPFFSQFQSSGWSSVGGGNYVSGFEFRHALSQDFRSQLTTYSSSGIPSLVMRHKVDGAWGSHYAAAFRNYAETITGAWQFNADLTMAADLNLLSNAIVWTNSVVDVNDAEEDQHTAMTFARIASAGTNTPETNNNANGILSLTSHVGPYGKQLFFADNDNLWMRRYTAGSFATWYRLLSTKDPIPFTDANETITGNWTFDTDDAGPMVTLGDGAGADGDSLLRFNTDRPWSFRQFSTGAGTALQLYAESGGKVFHIGSAADPSAFTFNPDAGIFNADTVSFADHLRVGNNSGLRIDVPTLRGTINVGGSADNGGVGVYHGYSINNDIMFMHNGTAAGIYDEVNNQWKMRFDTNWPGMEIYHNGARILRTSSNNIDLAGTNPFVGFYTPNFAARTGYIQSLGSSILRIRNEVHGGPVELSGESVGGTARNLFEGDPDGAAILYFQGGASIVTTAIGAIRSGRGAFPHFNSATNNSGRITTSTSAPSGTPAAGDIWIQHEA